MLRSGLYRDLDQRPFKDRLVESPRHYIVHQDFDKIHLAYLLLRHSQHPQEDVEG